MPQFAGWYRGWSMVILGGIMVMLTVGSVTYGYGIYISPVARDTGLSRETINTGLVFQHLGSALLAPFLGRLLDRFSIRVIVALAGIALGGALIALGIGNVLWPKALIILLPLSFGFQGAGSIASYVLVARWFKVQRGRAMALVAIGQTGSSVFFAPGIAKLIELYGWREALFIQGLIVTSLLLLIAWLIVERPEEGEEEPVKTAVPNLAAIPAATQFGAPLAYRDIIRRPVFWMMAAIVALTLGVVQAVIASLVPLATGRGLTLMEATTMLSSLGISGVVGKLVLAAIADRVDRRTLLAISLVMIFGFTVSLTFDLGSNGLLVASLVCGAAIGGFFPIYSAMLSDRFGAASLGTTEGLVSPMIAILAAVSVWFAGSSFDATGSYRHTFVIFSGVLFVAVILSVILRLATKAEPRQDRKSVV